MTLEFSPHPGPRERHLARKWNNPLFPEHQRRLAQVDVAEAVQQDRAELSAFMSRFEQLVREAMALRANEASQTVLELKARLDRAYTEAAGLPGDQEPIMAALRKLTDAVIRAVRAGAQDDPVAKQELDDEKQARAVHRRLLQYPLVADLMRPDSPIEREELMPTLLSEGAEAVEAALWLFGPEQLGELHAEGREHLERLRATGHEAPAAWQVLSLLEQAANPSAR